ncbi:Hypothetical predicted protein [Octopus vulgaris]|uniref:Uncharacterized protein n=2 Tax=Octopus vulgaris TaxID=6645 RepID=A0AA36AG81_OCTVU|nr:Hypothetical predicted protein [Octopus vulgaris]
MPKLVYPLRPWLIQYILNDQTLKHAKTLQVLKHCDGPLDDGTMVKIVGDGEVIMRANFPESSFESLEETERACWERSLIRVTDWDIKLTLADTKEKSDYIITIKVFDVWNNEEGYWPKYRLTPCKFDLRIAKKISELWEEAESAMLFRANSENIEEETDNEEEEIENEEEEIDSEEEESEGNLTLLLKAMGEECLSSTEDPVEADTLLNCDLLKNVSFEILQNTITTLCSEDFVIKPEENKILEEIPEWHQNSVLSASSVSQIISSHSKHIDDHDNELQQTTTVNNREPCDNSIVPQPNASSSSDEIIPGNPSVILNQNETNPEDEAQQQTISQADETMASNLCLPHEHQSENNLVAEDVLLPSQSNPRITSHSSDSDIEEETRLHNLALPSDEAADQCDIQPANQYENDHNVNEPLCSQDTVLTVTSTANDEYGFSSSFDHFENDLKRNVLKTSDCDSSQESNSNNKRKCVAPSFLVTSTAHESCQLSPPNEPALSEISVFNYNADSNLPVPQGYSSDDNDSNSVNLNSNEVVTSTAKELHKPELRNTHHSNNNSNKRTFSTYQIDSLDNQSHGNSCQFNDLTYASPSKRKHIEAQYITDESKLDALHKLKSLLKIPLITADQKTTTNWSLPENILTKINTYWSNNTSHHSIQ